MIEQCHGHIGVSLFKSYVLTVILEIESPVEGKWGEVCVNDL